MRVKRFVLFVLLVLFISIIYSACSKEDGEVVDNSNRLSNEDSLQDDSKSLIEDENEEINIKEDDDMLKGNENEKDIDKEEDVTDVTEVEIVSPWVLLSESSVDTKTDYAGFLNEEVGITVGYAGEISYTDDGGNFWTKSDNVSACRYGLDLYDESFIVTSGNSGVNLLSNDKGKSWTKLTDFPLKLGGEYNKFISAVDKDNIFIGSRISLGRSDDGGVTWKEIEIPDGCDSIVGMFFMTPEIGYLLNLDGTLYITNDSCKTWLTQTIDLQGEKIAYTKMPSAAINFQDVDHGMIVFATMSFKVFCIRTEDGGNTWDKIDMPKVYCFTPYISRDGRFLTLSSGIKKVCLYKFETE
ncbi:MAG: hypothetical protein GX129_12525 [Clostridiales bacterium]|jgi:photosystem II stability/assembly factor-like uncharacterized protein/cbb3-type cytochrome oxidase subunit 3|nr:hypothetical protein [Clostridiales bacterium]